MAGEIDPSVFKSIIQSIGEPAIFMAMGIPYKDSGHMLTFSSPFREDKNPSCVYYKDTGAVIDFAGDFRGNLFTFFKSVMGESLIKAFDVDSSFLDDKAFEGALKKDTKNRTAFRTPTTDRVRITGGSLVEVKDYALAQQYCAKRRIQEESIQHFGIKVAVHSIMNTMTYDKRLTIPIYNEYGALSSIEGRDLLEDPTRKKVLYPDTASTSLLFNFGSLDLSKPVIVVEGLIDLIQVWQAGFRNVTTTFGIQLTGIQIEQLQRIPYLILFPDYDDGGIKFVHNVEAVYMREFEVALFETWGLDPGEATVSQIVKAVEDRIPVSKFMIDYYELFKSEDLQFEDYL